MWRRGSRGEMACEMASMCVFSLSLPRFRSCSLFFLFVCLFYLFFFSYSILFLRFGRNRNQDAMRMYGWSNCAGPHL